MKRKITLLVLTCLLIISFTVPTFAMDPENESLTSLTLEDAVHIGLENSVVLKQVDNEIQISELNKKRTDYRKKKLDNAEEAIKEGQDMFNNQKSSLEQIINLPAAPVDIHLPDGSTIPKGTPLNDTIKTKIQAVIQSGEQRLEDAQSTLDNILEEAGGTISDKLTIDGLGALNIESTGNLLTTMANVSYEVTKASHDIYRNQIAMLIQKNYYAALQAQKMLEVKEKAMERAQKQYIFAKESYDLGMKAKDDMLLANIYYKGTQIEYQKAQGELDNALVAFKKNMNIPLDTPIVLSNVFTEDVVALDLAAGLQTAFKTRLEMKKATGEVIIYNLNFNIVKKKYPSNTFQYKEADLKKQKAQLNLEKTQTDVEESIRQSFQTLQTTASMLTTSKEMIEYARDSVEIAEYKYKEGFGTDSSLLKKLDLESAAGTIVEVLAAEENLAEVEEKVVQIVYGYTLAKMKYLNDIGQFIY